MLKGLREEFRKLWSSGRNKNRKNGIDSILETFNDYFNKGFDRNDLIYWLVKEETDSPMERVCPVCGNKIILKSVDKGYPQTCSHSCATKFSKDKRDETCLKRYGNSDVNKVKSIREKMNKTLVEKYGGVGFASDEILKKCQETNLKRYGNKDALKNPEIGKKAFESVIKNTGSSPILEESVILKRRKTMKRKYGCSFGFQSDVIRDKARSVIKEKYGVNSTLAIKEISEKSKKTLVEKYNKLNWNSKFDLSGEVSEDFKRLYADDLDKSYEKLLHNELVEPLFDRDHFYGWDVVGHKIYYDFKCKKCGTEFETNLPYKGCPIICQKCFKSSKSRYENELILFFSEFYSGEIIKESRTVLGSGKELDFYFPELKIAVEFNGDYYHSKEFGISDDYHLKKTIECEELGIRLFHVFMSEWLVRKDEIKNDLKSVILGNVKHPSSEELILNRSFPIYSNKDLTDYELIEILQPQPIDGSKLTVYDCGKLVYRKKIV